MLNMTAKLGLSQSQFKKSNKLTERQDDSPRHERKPYMGVHCRRMLGVAPVARHAIQALILRSGSSMAMGGSLLGAISLLRSSMGVLREGQGQEAQQE